MSAARANRDMYRKVVKKLESKITPLERAINDADDQIKRIDTKYKSYESEAIGNINDTFELKEEIWYQKEKSVLSKMKVALGKVKGRKNEALILVAYWEAKVRAEEAEKKRKLGL